MPPAPASPAAEVTVMPLLSVENLSKSFFGVEVLHGVHLTLEAGALLGLVGENGSGKSTTMNLVGGVLQPDAGTMLLDGRRYAPANPGAAQAAGIAFIHQELNLFPNLTIEENIFIAGFPRRHPLLPMIDRARIRRRTVELLGMVDLAVAPNTPVSRLSQGERQLVEIAKALNTDARIIIFDEPTTSLTKYEIDRLFGIIDRLKAKQIGIIYISHILTDVMQLSDTIAVLRDGHLIGQGARDEFTIDRMISMMVGRSIGQLFPSRDTRPTDEPVLEVEALTAPGIIRNVTFTVHKGEIVGLSGLMGAGRSETARLVFGLDPHKSGQVRIDGTDLGDFDAHAAMRAGMAFLTEDRRAEGLLMNSPIFDTEVLPNLERHASPRLGWIDGQALGVLTTEYSRRVQLNTEDLKIVLSRNLSGGNQQKVVLAKWLMRGPKLFILDEPTRGVDVGAKAEIYKIINSLVADGCGVLLISSELEELTGMCDRILVMNNGEITGSFERGGFDPEAMLEAAMRQGTRASA